MSRPGRSLFARTATTLALAFLIFQASAFWVIYRTLVVPVAERSADDLAGLIVLSAQTWVELPPQTRAAFEHELARRHGLRLTTVNIGEVIRAPNFPFRVEIENALSRRLDDDIVLQGVAGNKAAWLTMPVGGFQLHIGFYPDRYAVKFPLAAVALITMGGLLTLLTTLLMVRRITVPLARAANAAGQVGAGEVPEPLPETGPAELAELARRFNRMAHEVKALLDNRTTLLAGISHDLRTPMTRLQLNLELLRDHPDSHRIDKAVADLADMNQLIRGYLELARTTQAEPPVRFDVSALLQTIAAEAELAGPNSGPHFIEGGPLAVRQIVTNLIQNAQRYAGDAPIALRLEHDMESTRITVLDGGSGIPHAQLEQVFRPFYRLEASRSLATGGTGLGLAIVRQLAESNGWKVTLINRPEGGLAATLKIPAEKNAVA
ncbi:MAG: ATP-binding protein [Thiobacillus sp.]